MDCPGSEHTKKTILPAKLGLIIPESVSTHSPIFLQEEFRLTILRRGTDLKKSIITLAAVLLTGGSERRLFVKNKLLPLSSVFQLFLENIPFSPQIDHFFFHRREAYSAGYFRKDLIPFVRYMKHRI